MDRLIDTYKISKLTQEGINMLKNPIINNEFHSIKQNISTKKKAQDLAESLLNSTKFQNCYNLNTPQDLQRNLKG